MIMHPEVSVILPFYNAEKTLAEAAGSIRIQSFTEFELLLVDNNSSDDSSNIAQALAGRDSRIRVLQENQQGVDYAMNRGLQEARGKFVARMDADDVSLPQRLEKQVAFLRENPETGLVGSTVRYVAHSSNTKGFRHFVSWVNSFYTSEEIETYRFVEIPVVNPTIMFRAELYKTYGGCRNGNFPEDYEMLLRYLNAGVKMAKLPEALLEWHDYATRLTRTNERYTSEAFFRIKAEYFSRWSEENNPFHPQIWIWGAGRKTRQRVRFLEEAGLAVQGYFDLVKDKASGKITKHFTEVPAPDELFIVSMVRTRGAQEQIREYLVSRKYKEGINFMVLA